jgi:cyclase
MQSVTSNVFTDTTLRGCNPSFVVTRDGVVVIDTPQLPTRAVAMRKEAESHGPIRYLINTEHHVDTSSATTTSRAPAWSSTTKASTTTS